ncbi:MAG: cell division protein ZapE [Limnohabitans sp.]|nr:cell division protein ZapE [Limnohabitans sp.]
MSVLQAYQAEIKKRGYQSDAAQLNAVAALQRCADDWAVYKTKRSNKIKKIINHLPVPKGVYLYGGVGRGKSFLMDCFYQSVPIQRKTRLHFHEFMREVHRELRELQGTVNPLDELARRISKRFKLICLDEFHVADITDAMILHRLLSALYANEVGLITTSNFKPDLLYPDGLHRERILPAIDLLNQTMDVVQVDAGVDYRLQTLKQVQLYQTPLSKEVEAEINATFLKLAEAVDDSPTLQIDSRQFQAVRRAGGIVWFDFQVLCAGLRSQNDYLEIAAQFHTVFLSNVPKMTGAMASPARRFTLLIDVLYDRHIKLIISAEVLPEQLYTQGPFSHEFPRTVSRLREMQSAEFLSLQRRHVNTSLT